MKKLATQARRVIAGVYLSQAYVNAFRKYDEPDWDTEQGYVANRDRIVCDDRARRDRR